MSSIKDQDFGETNLIPVSHKVVRFENTLNAAAHDLSIIEQRILFSAISKVGKDQVITTDSLFEITEEDIKKLAKEGEYAGGVYARMIEGVERLLKRPIMIPNTELDLSELVSSNPTPRTRKERFTQVDCRKILPLSECAYQKGEGRIFLSFSKNFLPYVSNLRDNFYTMYRLSEIRGLQSRYSIPLYSMMMQFMHEKGGGLDIKPGGWFQIDIPELRRRLMAEKRYPRMTDFQKHLLAPVVKELNESEYTTFNVTYKCITKGRKITHIAFTMTAKENVNPSDNKAAEDIEPVTPTQKISLSEAQINMFADKLAGRNKKVNEAGYSSSDFISDLYHKSLVPRGYFTGADTDEVANRIKDLMLTKEGFLDEIESWLITVGYKVKKTKK